MSTVPATTAAVAQDPLTQTLIDAAVEAHGGEALLEKLDTLIIEQRTINYSVDQSFGTEPPWED